ncbi:Nuclear pore protein-like protein [Colletotrichum higginsianum IMI 349063]|uniref:Nuclear pore protein-like protein n=2 Tax=Colletotrichum higginsianum TaxID=80884 RepID=A0A1B7YSK9_COLHI|nr:Nuclear pore protein-like protein [Colletotrichum higginsianum IMI 349063]OBR15017.1 Nuclear pore protein-like protein [Colletotrichum higginsianum IMI 349063]TID04773.1 hypothetical protein CH35J_003142 [Colletotrichum higginsianum]
MDLFLETEPFFFDPRGDLTLKVGNEEDTGGKYTFVVCSRTLARSSTVFTAMLFSGFAESCPREDSEESSWTVELPEDSPYSFSLLMDIIHGHFASLPDMLRARDLHDLLILTNKYDMTHVLHPLARTWFRPYKKVTTCVGNETVLWIAWELGHKELCRKLIRHLILESRVDEYGQLLDSNGDPLPRDSFLEGPGVLDHVAQVRNSLIQNIASLFHKAIQSNLDGNGCKAPTRPSMYCYMTKTIQCDSINVGALVRYTRTLGFQGEGHGQIDTSQYLGSVRDLASSVEQTGFDRMLFHLFCNPLPGIRMEIQDLLDSVALPALESYSDYFQQQAKKTGIERGVLVGIEEGEPSRKRSRRD